MRFISSMVGIMILMTGMITADASSTSQHDQKVLFTAFMVAEINTFSPFSTTIEDFNRTEPGAGQDNPLFSFVIDAANARDWHVEQGLGMDAMPAGLIEGSAFASIKNEILDGLRSAMPVDAVVLLLHGAIVADGVDDGEGDILQAVREIVGPDVPVGAGLDAHAHLSARMVEMADILVFMKEWPHIDVPQTIEDATNLTIDFAEGAIDPHMEVYDCRMIADYHTLVDPMKQIVDRMKAAEGANGVLSVSLIHGFALADVPDMGTKVLVITNNQPQVGAKLARDIGQQVFALRGRTHAPYSSIQETIEKVTNSDKSPIVLADLGDITGGGSPGDATYLLQALIDNGIDQAAIAYIWDPFAADTACKAGEGARLCLRIGGKACKYSGSALDLDVEVIRTLREFSFEEIDGSTTFMGNVAVVRTQGIDIILNSERVTALHYNRFVEVGIDPLAKKVLVVKSANNFYAGFEEIAAEVIYVDTPGLTDCDITRLPYSRVSRPLWPFFDDPTGEASWSR